jgi:hypothetical protein
MRIPIIFLLALFTLSNALSIKKAVGGAAIVVGGIEAARYIGHKRIDRIPPHTSILGKQSKWFNHFERAFDAVLKARGWIEYEEARARKGKILSETFWNSVEKQPNSRLEFDTFAEYCIKAKDGLTEDKQSDTEEQ